MLPILVFSANAFADHTQFDWRRDGKNFARDISEPVALGIFRTMAEPILVKKLYLGKFAQGVTDSSLVSFDP